MVASTTSHTCRSSKYQSTNSDSEQQGSRTYAVEEVKFPCQVFQPDRVNKGVESCAATSEELQDGNSFRAVNKREHLGNIYVCQWLHDVVAAVEHEDHGNDSDSSRVTTLLGVRSAQAGDDAEGDDHASKGSEVLNTTAHDISKERKAE